LTKPGDGIGSRYFNVQNANSDNIPALALETAVPPSPVATVTLRNSFDFQREPQSLTPDEAGAYSVEMVELGRIELRLGATDGNLLVNGERRSLPVGSTLKDGVFYWQPGPGYFGEYYMVFHRLQTDDSSRDEHVHIRILRKNQEQN
jgi:hypothetical protein